MQTVKPISELLPTMIVVYIEKINIKYLFSDKRFISKFIRFFCQSLFGKHNLVCTKQVKDNK